MFFFQRSYIFFHILFRLKTFNTKTPTDGYHCISSVYLHNKIFVLHSKKKKKKRTASYRYTPGKIKKKTMCYT